MSIKRTCKCTRVADRRELFGRERRTRPYLAAVVTIADLGLRLVEVTFFSFPFFSPFFSRFSFIGSALLDNGSWRHMETSLLFVSQRALPVRFAASPRSQSVDLSNRELGWSCGALNRTVCSKLRILKIEIIGRCSSRARERLWLLHNLRRSTPDNNSIYLERE